MPHPPLSILILAGGKSTRMGQDKAWLLLDGQPLIERAARRVLPLAREIIFSTQEPDRYRELIAALPVPAHAVTDLYPSAGPLGGLHACLRAARCELTLLLAVDLPFVNLTLLAHMIELAEGCDVVVPRAPVRSTGTYPFTELHPELEPLHALYRRACLPAIERHLQAGHRRVVSFFPDVRVRELTMSEVAALDPDFRSFFNVNTPEDWERASSDRDFPKP